MFFCINVKDFGPSTAASLYRDMRMITQVVIQHIIGLR